MNKPKTFLNEVTKESEVIALVSVTDFQPIEKLVSLNNLMTCGIKKSKQRYYFVTEIEKVVPNSFMRNFDKPLHIVKESQLIA